MWRGARRCSRIVPSVCYRTLLRTVAEQIGQADRPEDERVASLVGGFEFGTKLACTLHDELLDVNGETKVLRLVKAIVDRLDTISSGRTALAVLLDHPDARVRAHAGASLVRLMPERVLPILREIEEKSDGDSAHFTAHWAIVGWEREGKYGVKPKQLGDRASER